MATCLRCSLCGISWPPKNEYKVCPQCEEQTSPFKAAQPIDEAEARSLASKAKFERWLEENDRA